MDDYDSKLYHMDQLLEKENEERIKNEELERQRLAAEAAQQAPETSSQPTTNTKGPQSKLPEGHPFKKSEGELGRAIAGGVIDLYNSVGSLPKFLDKRFYQPTDPDNPWKYDAPWLINRKPIQQTAWGSFIRSGVELATGFVGTGKVLWGVKGLKGLSTAAKGSRLGRLGLGAAQGATYDIISNQSQEGNLAKYLIDVKPQWAGLLAPIATTETMSPFLTSVANVGEGLGIGAFFDLAFEGLGLGLKSISKDADKAAKKAIGKQDKLTKALKESKDVDYEALTQKVEKGAKGTYERSLYRKLKVKEKEGISITEWRKTKPWEKLNDEQRLNLMEIYSDKKNLDWGEYRDLTKRAIKQGKANRDLAVEQLEYDLSVKQQRKNPAYYKGGDVSDNQALSSGDNPVKSLRDMIEIRNNPTQKYGSPEGVMTEANIRRAAYAQPGLMYKEAASLAKKLQSSPAYQRLYDKPNSKVITADLKNAATDIFKFISESGNSRLIDIPEEDIISYIKLHDIGKKSEIKGYPILSKAQLNATDVLLGQLLFEARDLAKASLSVADQINPASPGGMLDGILSRYAAVARLKKETSIIASKKGKIDLKAVAGQASDEVASDITAFKELLQGDLNNDLLESFIHFTAVSNGSKQTWKDLQSFYKKKLKGYKQGDVYQRNAILNEMMTMGVNSMLSSPKTPVRALVGTGLGTVMRPVSTLLGALGESDDQVFRGAMASIGGMVEARNDAWRKAVADFQSYNLDTKGFRGFTESAADQEWEAMKSYFAMKGTRGEKAMMLVADSMRNINKSPFLNYGPRLMKSMDTFFSQLIGRGRMRQLAFDDVYTKLRNEGITVSDTDLDDLVRKAEVDFENKVFSSDGQITDEMALFAADEAKLTKELTGFAKDLDVAFDKMPMLKPFFLFARTGVNALVMTSKYTPLLNMVIKEHVDIMTKAWDAPEMLQYGIKSQSDLNIAKATMKGRWAIGYGVTATAAGMALNGQITGNGPPDRALRDSWIQQGWQPRSFKIGDSYISYEAIEPFNMFFSFIADTVDAQSVMGDEWVGNHFGKAAYLLSANVTNKSFLAGLLQLQDLLTSQGQDAPRVAANFVNNQIPLAGLRNEVGKVFSPGMRELESGFWQSVGNRNLWADLITPNNMLPYRYDILNGEVLRDWNPINRLVNGILPFNINVGASNETRELLMRSGLNLKQTFNTGPEGQILEDRSDLKSKFQFYMGQQNIESQLNDVFTDEVRDSIERMEKGTKDYEAGQTLHGKIITPIFRTAKRRAWDMLLEDPELGGDAQRLDILHGLGTLRDSARSYGDYNQEASINKEIEQLKNIPK